MSTISKLDPRVRRARADRRSLIVSLAEGRLTSAGAALHQVLEKIRRRSDVDGKWKAVLFEDNLTRYEVKHNLSPKGRAALTGGARA